MADLEARTFHYFWDLASPDNGLVPDRSPTPSFASVAAVGFALTAYTVGVERGYVPRAEAARRVRLTLDFLARAPSGPQGSAVTSYKGFFYHFLDMKTGYRFEHVELSTVDTALLMAGVLTCETYFDHDDGPDGVETAIRARADELYRRVDWAWATPKPPAIALGWSPEEGFIPYDWRGYNEAMIVYILALGSPTHPVAEGAWGEWTRNYQWGSHYGQTYLQFGPLFGHQYSQIWIDFKGIRDDYMRGQDSDYFENSRRATYAQRAYATANPEGFAGYGENVWGMTACDGPADTTLTVDGKARTFHTYWARGTARGLTQDDGTLSPTAAAGSIAFAPEIVLPALVAMKDRYGEALYSKYGFLDAFNPTFPPGQTMRHGRMVPGLGWFDTDYLGIDEGPIVAMIENYRSGLLWKTLHRNPYLVRGLRRAGFQGGWLDAH